MAAFDTTRPTKFGIGSGIRLNGVMNALLDAFSTWNDKRATRNMLGKLTDRELDDIGLLRGDIDRIVG